MSGADCIFSELFGSSSFFGGTTQIITNDKFLYVVSIGGVKMGVLLGLGVNGG